MVEGMFSLWVGVLVWCCVVVWRSGFVVVLTDWWVVRCFRVGLLCVVWWLGFRVVVWMYRCAAVLFFGLLVV